MYEFLILAQLSRRPMHGYMIAKIIGAMIGPFRQVQWGALYPVLNRLVADRLIEANEDEENCDGRARKVYAITPAGRVRLHEHMLDTEHHHGDYAPVFAYKVAFFHLLTPGERLRVSRHYSVYAQQHIDHLERKCRDVAELPHLTDEQRGDILTVMQHALEHWKHERDWAERLIAQQTIEEAV